jgi:signal transduction histidine kinase/HAMP domain-containing protein
VLAARSISRDTVFVNRNDRWSPAALWRRLTLWPRLAIGVTIGFVVLFVGFSILGIRAVDASTNRILHERLAISEELAQDFDGLLEHRFSDLTAFDSRPSPPSVERRLLAEIYHASGGAFTTLSLLDRSGRVLDSLGQGAPSPGSQFAGKGRPAGVLANGRRAISGPFRDSRHRPVVALSVPIRADGTVREFLVGTLNLAGPDVMERLDAARRFGRTGHAELVGPDGIALASTEPGSALTPGEHLAFYRKMLKAEPPAIANVPVTTVRREPADLQHERHTMAFVRLSIAPWAVALGGTESETYAPAHHLRRTLMLAGGGSLAALWLLTLIGARLLVRPVRGLTRAAEQMASGNLERTVSVSEGGEIGVLAESLETMRAQLKDSLETVRRWGEELELKVADRTGELNARNRQLAAVSAILAAANETHDLEGMLQRCLDVVLEQAAMEGAALRLLDEGRGQPAETFARGSWNDFPCRSCTDRLCLAAATDGKPVYLDPHERGRLHPDCTVPGEALAILPLRGPSGVVGVLALGRRNGELPTPEERPILMAICDQIAVAVENTRLAAELRRLEAQHQAQRMRSELISAVSHELRTPLGFIKGYATTLLREDTPIESATRRHFLEIIDEETDKLEHMIDELLDASRLQAGRLPIKPEPVALGALVSHAVDKARPTLEESGHTVVLRLLDENVAVFADPLRIEQVLDNLLENAARYSDPSSPVEVTILADDGHALVSVTDRGDGIPTAELEQIFQPFYRGDNATQRGIRGAGLGLAICRGIVEAHGGKIWGESGDDRTTTFLLTLPLTGRRAA